MHIVDCLYLCWPIAWLRHGVQIKVLELFSSFSRFLINFPYYSSGFEIKVCHSNWLVKKLSSELYLVYTSSSTVLRMKGTLRSRIPDLHNADLTTGNKWVFLTALMIACNQLYCISISPASDKFSSSSRIENTASTQEFCYSNFPPPKRQRRAFWLQVEVRQNSWMLTVVALCVGSFFLWHS